MKEVNGSQVSILFSFPNDKISKEERMSLANTFAGILQTNVLVCDKDCEITIINHRSATVMEAQDDRD